MHLSSCVHHRDTVKSAGTTNQCWQILFVKADTGERRRQPVFTDQLLRRTQDVRVGEGKGGEKLETSCEEPHFNSEVRKCCD